MGGVDRILPELVLGLGSDAKTKWLDTFLLVPIYVYKIR